MACAKKLAISFTPEGTGSSHKIKLSGAYLPDIEDIFEMQADADAGATRTIRTYIDEEAKKLLMNAYLSDIIFFNSENDHNGDSGKLLELEHFLAKPGYYRVKIAPEYEIAESTARTAEPETSKSLFSQLYRAIKQAA